jgi:electron transport complex protein RnfG
VGVAVIAGLVIAAVFEATAPRIAANRAEKLAAAMALMLPRVHSWKEYALDDANRLVPAAADQPATIYAVYDADGALLGFTIKAQVMGYQDRILALYGYDPFAANVVGLEILASLETPGLGSRIATDAKFRANFRALDVSLDRSGQRLANPILVVPEGSRRQPWEIDAITGATVSSRAIGKLLNTSATSTLPVIHQNLPRLRDG